MKTGIHGDWESPSYRSPSMWTYTPGTIGPGVIYAPYMPLLVIGPYPCQLQFEFMVDLVKTQRIKPMRKERKKREKQSLFYFASQY